VAIYNGAPIADVTKVQTSGHARRANQGGFDSNDVVFMPRFFVPSGSGRAGRSADLAGDGTRAALPPLE
jgi:hypothetical protein